MKCEVVERLAGYGLESVGWRGREIVEVYVRVDLLIHGGGRCTRSARTVGPIRRRGFPPISDPPKSTMNHSFTDLAQQRMILISNAMICVIRQLSMSHNARMEKIDAKIIEIKQDQLVWVQQLSPTYWADQSLTCLSLIPTPSSFRHLNQTSPA